jgi:hypothetical protein
MKHLPIPPANNQPLTALARDLVRDLVVTLENLDSVLTRSRPADLPPVLLCELVATLWDSAKNVCLA